ncbi:unnamed protein product [Polarella glacialis]|uniref:Uncharacterized protein n=1 Tax=Polarella glacialis TaxID=89957 RepID=A0A813FIC7_POLGL|nr:unnamed protein product [Polarella glacialis]
MWTQPVGHRQAWKLLPDRRWGPSSSEFAFRAPLSAMCCSVGRTSHRCSSWPSGHKEAKNL